MSERISVKGSAVFLVILVVALSGCSTRRSTGPSPAIARLDLSLASLSLTDMDQVSSLTVTALDDSGEVVELDEEPQVYFVGEVREIEALPVLTTAWQAPLLQVTAAGPGSVGLFVRAGEVVSDTVQVTVTTSRAIVLGLVAPERALPGDEAALTGYQMDSLDVADVMICDSPVPFMGATPDSFRFTVPDLAGTACSATSTVEVQIGPSGRAVATLELVYFREQEFDLAPGEYEMLGAAQDNTLSLAAHPGAKYVLAYIDMRPVVQATTTYETDNWPYTPLTLQIGPASAVSSVSLSVPASSRPRRNHVKRLDTFPPQGTASDIPPADYYGYRNTPWQVGDRVSVDDPAAPGTFASGSVIKIYGGYLCVVTLDKDAAYQIPNRLLELDANMSSMETHGYPILEAALSPNRPEAGTGTGQVLMVITTLDFVGGATLGEQGVFLINPGLEGSSVEVPLGIGLDLVAHESAHMWQFGSYSADLCASMGVCTQLGPAGWSLEGSAALVAEEVMRNMMGNPLTGTAPFWGAYNGGSNLIGSGPSYSFSRGYGGASWFLRDQLVRLVQSGVAYDVALGEVTKGAVDGWYGIGPSGGQRPGMVQRMSALFGRAWDPFVELPEAMARLFLDDRPNDTYPALLEAWGDYLALVTLTPASAMYTVNTEGGTFAQFEIDDQGAGGTYTYSSPVSDIHWVLMRIQ